MPNQTNYSFPHVAISKYAVPRTTAAVEESNAPVMFVPFRSSKGPSNVLRTVYTLGEFTDLYGAECFEDYSNKEHELLNISNWLSAGGAVLALRLAGVKDAIAASSAARPSVVSYKTVNYNFAFQSKYAGSFYKGMKLYITKPSDSTIYFTVVSSDRRTEYEKFSANARTLESLIGASEYFQINEDVLVSGSNAHDATIAFLTMLIEMKRTDFNTAIASGDFELSADLEHDNSNISTSRVNNAIVIAFDSYKNGASGVPTTEVADLEERNALVENLFRSVLPAIGDPVGPATNSYFTADTLPGTVGYSLLFTLLNKLESPIDVFMDASYSYDLKRLILKNFAYPRDDIHFFMNMYVLDDEESIQMSSSAISTYITKTTGSEEGNEENPNYIYMNDEDGDPINFTNVSFYAQYLVVNNSYTDTDIKVGPTYFLAMLVAEDEINYGIQYPVAGLTRGVLTGVRSMSDNPDPDTKQELYDAQTNYVERDSRGYRLMCQLTRDLENTALIYVNNSRTTNRIARELEAIGRRYLFEFNDTTTLSNMRNEMNKYMNNWIQNRTLSTVNLEVERTGDNSVEVQLGIRFTGTIEIIAVAITIE